MSTWHLLSQMYATSGSARKKTPFPLTGGRSFRNLTQTPLGSIQSFVFQKLGLKNVQPKHKEALMWFLLFNALRGANTGITIISSGVTRFVDLTSLRAAFLSSDMRVTAPKPIQWLSSGPLSSLDYYHTKGSGYGIGE